MINALSYFIEILFLNTRFRDGKRAILGTWV